MIRALLVVTLTLPLVAAAPLPPDDELTVLRDWSSRVASLRMECEELRSEMRVPSGDRNATSRRAPRNVRSGPNNPRPSSQYRRVNELIMRLDTALVDARTRIQELEDATHAAVIDDLAERVDAILADKPNG